MDESSVLADFRTKFRVEELLVAKNTAWSWSLRPAQATLGCGILSLNRHVARFSEVTAAEMAQLAELLPGLEMALRSAFGYQAINYLMLMMVDHHVHFHVIPRYEGRRQFAGLEWFDHGWPAFPAMAEQQHSNHESILAQIREALKSVFPT